MPHSTIGVPSPLPNGVPLRKPVLFERSAKEVKILFNGIYIAETDAPLLVWEEGSPVPHWYVSQGSLRMSQPDVHMLSRERLSIDGEDDAYVEQIEIFVGDLGDETLGAMPGKSTRVKVWNGGPLNGFVRFEFDEMDAWFECGALTRHPPKSPTYRVETAFVSDRFVVSVHGTVIADSVNAVVLFETGKPPRYYLPATSVVKWKWIRESTKRDACPYKGEARFFSIDTGVETLDNVVLCCLYPMAACAAIAGRLCFMIGVEGLKTTMRGVELKE